MKNHPLVSVLMPSYNSEKFIGIAIQSVLNSTYTNFELIITDDKSTDNTYKIAKSFQEKDARVSVYLNDKNYGDYPNRNKAASYAQGKYLKYVDHDDFIYPHGLEQLVYYMEQFPEAGYGLTLTLQDNNKPFPFTLNPEEAYQRHYFKKAIFNKSPLGAIIRKEIFEQVGGFCNEKFIGDFDIWHKLSSKSSVLLMHGGVCWYRIHPGQESHKMRVNPEGPFRYFLISIQYLESDNCPLKVDQKALALKKVHRQMSRYILHFLKKRRG